MNKATTEKQDQRIVSLCEKGKSVSQIAETIGVNPSVVRRVLLKAGYTPNHRGVGASWAA